MKRILSIAAPAAAVCLSGCAVVEKVATPENLDRVTDAINRKIASVTRSQRLRQ